MNQVGPSSSSIDPEAILARCYPTDGLTFRLLLHHGQQVGQKALAVLDAAPWVSADRDFVWDAAMLHDIGIGETRCPELGCTGRLPYVYHGIKGRAILDGMGLDRHGLVCERHVGVGFRVDEIVSQHLDLPHRDMLPLSVEECLICYADKFFSKTDDGRHEKTIGEIMANLSRHGSALPDRFARLHHFFSEPPVTE